jgi:hypothetical protein
MKERLRDLHARRARLSEEARLIIRDSKDAVQKYRQVSAETSRLVEQLRSDTSTLAGSAPANTDAAGQS